MSAIQLNIYEAQKERDKGIAKAINHANEVIPEWADKAYEKLKEFLGIQIGEFQAEDVRSFAAVDDDFPLPPSREGLGWNFCKGYPIRINKESWLRSCIKPESPLCKFKCIRKSIKTWLTLAVI